MHRLTLSFALAACSLAACSKKQDAAPAPPPAPQAVHGKTVAASDPVSLPPAGTAPAAVAVDKELDRIWTTPLKTLSGKPATLGDFKGKAVMLVNVASQCGNTPQYSALEALQKKYGPKGFTVVGFPCNQFGGQEPGTAEEIQTFCSTNFGITFPIMEKTEVNGEHRNEVYKALTTIADASGHTGDIRWNFEKFVVSADGKQITRFNPKIQPDDPAVIASVEAALPH